VAVAKVKAAVGCRNRSATGAGGGVKAVLKVMRVAKVTSEANAIVERAAKGS
jgi:hypothetical protein